MPEPEWANMEYDPTEPPNVGTEILGRGNRARKSKTYIDNGEAAFILGLIAGHYRRLVEQLRRLHAKKHTRVRFFEAGEKLSGPTLMELCRDSACRLNADDAGAVGTRHVHEPEVLSDQEIHEWYPVTLEWLQNHQEQVDHSASTKGFSIRAASGMDREQGQGGGGSRGDSSAGADRSRQGGGNGSDAKWR